MGRAVKNKAKKISIWNWMGTILLCCIPGVNLIASILFIIFARTQSKRGFAIAALILQILAIVLVCAAFLIFTEELSQFAAELRGGDAINLLVSPAG